MDFAGPELFTVKHLLILAVMVLVIAGTVWKKTRR